MKKVLSTALSVLIFITNVVLVHAFETNIWSERTKQSATSTQLARLPSQVPGLDSQRILNQLPPIQAKALKPLIQPKHNRLVPIIQGLSNHFGTLQAIHQSPQPSNRTVVAISDVHQNQEAQQNIGQAIAAFQKIQTIDFIGLEGAFGPISLSGFRSYPDQQLVQEVSNYALEKNLITGPVQTALVSETAFPPLMGIDDPSLYNKNLTAYLQTRSHRDEQKKTLIKMRGELAAAKKTHFNPDLTRFDQLVTQYQSNKTTLGSYLSALNKHQSSGDEIFTPMIELFLEAMSLEESLNFQHVEAERTRLLRDLVQKVTPDQLNQLIQQSLAYRMKHVSHSDFYAYLVRLCGQANLPMHRYPAMRDYLQYLSLSTSIKTETLFQESRTRETSIYASLIQTEVEKDLVQQSREIYLVGKLLNFALTPEEWEEYKQVQSSQSTNFRHPGQVRPGRTRAGIQSDFKKRVDPGSSVAGATSVRDDALRHFERFYHEAEKRDRAMAKNLMRQMDKQNADLVVLVTGGFHSPGLTAQLLDKNINVLNFVPSVTQVDSTSDSDYLSVFTQEHVSLDRIFDGRKLYLGQNPAQLKTVGGLLGLAGHSSYPLTLSRLKSIHPEFSRATGVYVKAGASAREATITHDYHRETIQITPGIQKPILDHWTDQTERRFRIPRWVFSILFLLSLGFSTPLLLADQAIEKDKPGQIFDERIWDKNAPSADVVRINLKANLTHVLDVLQKYQQGTAKEEDLAGTFITLLNTPVPNVDNKKLDEIPKEDYVFINNNVLSNKFEEGYKKHGLPYLVLTYRQAAQKLTEIRNGNDKSDKIERPKNEPFGQGTFEQPQPLTDETGFDKDTGKLELDLETRSYSTDALSSQVNPQQNNKAVDQNSDITYYFNPDNDFIQAVIDDQYSIDRIYVTDFRDNGTWTSRVWVRFHKWFLKTTGTQIEFKPPTHFQLSSLISVLIGAILVPVLSSRLKIPNESKSNQMRRHGFIIGFVVMINAIFYFGTFQGTGYPFLSLVLFNLIVVFSFLTVRIFYCIGSILTQEI